MDRDEFPAGMQQRKQTTFGRAAAWWRRLGKSPATESVCGKCGYVVSGLPDFTCPECGSDLREVGIARRMVAGPAEEPPYPTWPARIRRQFRLQSALALVLTLALIPIVPSWHRDYRDLAYIPKSGAYRALTISGEFTRLHFLAENYAAEPSALDLRLTFTGNDGAGHAFTVSLPELRMSRPMRVRGPVSFNLTRTTALDREELVNWLTNEAGIPMKGAAADQEVNALTHLLHRYNNAAPGGWDSLTAAIGQDLEPAFNRGTWMMSGGASSGQLLLSAIPLTGIFVVIVWALFRRAERRAKAALIADGKWEEPVPESGPTESRTLTVVFTDVKDFTTRAAAASRGELIRLVRDNRRSVENAVKRHRGRVVKTVGDGILCSFESATDAVLAALYTQHAASLRGAGEPVELRIGISTGEVTVADDDVYGPVVNVAARLQALAAAGEVYLTESTRYALSAAEVGVEPVGQFHLKGIAEELTVYRAIPRPAADGRERNAV